MLSQQLPDKDNVFRNYVPDQAQVYAGSRPPYPDQFIQTVIDMHTASGGSLETLVDIGCGPGTATRSVSPFFDHAYALDPSSAMVATANSIPSTTKSGKPVTYATSAAEDLDKTLHSLNVPDSSVDLITAASCAHFFQMPPFYAAASRMLKPGGSIALWCVGGFHIDPRTTPNATAVQQMFDEFGAPGNKLCRGYYKDLVLPWNDETSSLTPDKIQLLSDLPESEFVKKIWNKDGKMEEGEPKCMWQSTAKVDDIMKLMETMGFVTRWRQANADKLKSGELEDVVVTMGRRLRDALGGVGTIDLVAGMALLFFKKKVMDD